MTLLGLPRRQKPLVLQTRQLRAERFFRYAGFIARELHKKVRRFPLLAPLQRRGLQKLWHAPRGRRRRADVGFFGGLGIEVTKDGKSGVQVVSPIDDTPAAKAGVRAGDIIIKIDNTFTYDLTLSKCVKMMRGKPKTPVTLQIMRKGVKKPITIKLVRSIIKVQSVKAKELPDGIGYIRIFQF